MSSLTPRIAQTTNDLGTLYRDAGDARPEIATRLAAVAEASGGFVDMPDGLKDREKADKNIAKRFGNDASRITDIARGSVVVENLDDMRRAHDALLEGGGVVTFNDRVVGKSNSAYRDLQYGVVADNGHICEVQIHLKPLWEAKNESGHEIYSQIGALYDQAEADGRDELNQPEKKERRRLFEAGRKLYKAAIRESGIDVTEWKTPENQVTAEDVERVMAASHRNRDGVEAMLDHIGGTVGWRDGQSAALKDTSALVAPAKKGM